MESKGTASKGYTVESGKKYYNEKRRSSERGDQADGVTHGGVARRVPWSGMATFLPATPHTPRGRCIKPQHLSVALR